MAKETKYLLKVTPAQFIWEEKYNTETNPPTLLSRKLKEVVSAFTGYDFALQSVTQGPKLFEIWELRSRLKKLAVPENHDYDARYVVLTAEERELLLQGFRTIDWTFQQQVTFWVRWDEFFADVKNITDFDEENPPIEYVTWKHEFEQFQVKLAAERKAAEERVLAERKAAEERKAAKLAEIRSRLLGAKLEELVGLGKLGSAAGVEDIPAGIAADIELQVQAEYEAFINAPVKSDVVETKEPSVPQVEADEII